MAAIEPVFIVLVFIVMNTGTLPKEEQNTLQIEIFITNLTTLIIEIGLKNK